MRNILFCTFMCALRDRERYSVAGFVVPLHFRWPFYDGPKDARGQCDQLQLSSRRVERLIMQTSERAREEKREKKGKYNSITPK